MRFGAGRVSAPFFPRLFSFVIPVNRCYPLLSVARRPSLVALRYPTLSDRYGSRTVNVVPSPKTLFATMVPPS